MISVKSLKSIIKTQRGEIATILTLISVGLMLAGIVVGNVAVKQTTRIQPRAATQNPDDGIPTQAPGIPIDTNITQAPAAVAADPTIGQSRDPNALPAGSLCDPDFNEKVYTCSYFTNSTNSKPLFKDSDSKYHKEETCKDQSMSDAEAKTYCGVPPPAASTDNTSSPNTVSLRDTSFEPAYLSINGGDGNNTVTWKNNDPFNHELQSGSPQATTDLTGLFDHIIHPGEIFSYTFKKSGVYPYFCGIHGTNMMGVIAVQTNTDPAPPAKRHCWKCLSTGCDEKEIDSSQVCGDTTSGTESYSVGTCEPDNKKTCSTTGPECRQKGGLEAQCVEESVYQKNGGCPQSLELSKDNYKCQSDTLICCVPKSKSPSTLPACDKDKYPYNGKDSCTKSGCNDCSQCNLVSALGDNKDYYECTGTSTDKQNVTCEYYKNCDKEANSDENSQLGACNTSKLNPDHGLRDDIACSQGGIGSVFVCRLDAKGTPKWFKEFSEKTFYCTEEGKKNMVPPVPTDSACYPLVKENPFYADCSRTAKPDSGHCEYGSYWSVCLPDKDCPEDARFGVSLPYWCGKDNTGYVSNKFGECNKICKGSKYNITPAPNKLCSNEERGTFTSTGTKVGDCQNYICAEVRPGVSHWVKTFLYCDGKGSAYKDWDARDGDSDTGKACTLTAGKNTVTKSCGNDFDPIIENDGKIPAQKPGAPKADADCKAYKCSDKNDAKKFSFKLSDTTKFYTNENCSPGDTSPKSLGDYCAGSGGNMCTISDGNCKSSGEANSLKSQHQCIKEDANNKDEGLFWSPKDLPNVKIRVTSGCTGNNNFCCSNNKEFSDPFNPIPVGNSSSDRRSSTDGICTIDFPKTWEKSKSFVVKVTVLSSTNQQYYDAISAKFTYSKDNITKKLEDATTIQSRPPIWEFKKDTNKIDDIGNYKVGAEFVKDGKTITCGGTDSIEITGTASTVNPPSAAKCLPDSLTNAPATKIEQGCMDCMKTNINKDGDKVVDKLSKYNNLCSGDNQKINKFCTDPDAVSNNSLCYALLNNTLCKSSCTSSTGWNLYLTPFSYDNNSFDKVVAAVNTGKINAIAASIWVLNATRVPGLQRLYCDPFQGQCDYGVTSVVQQQVDASQNNNSDSKNVNQIADNGNSLAGNNLSVLDCCAITKGTEKIIYKPGGPKKEDPLYSGNPVTVIRDKDNNITDIIVFDVNEGSLKQIFEMNTTRDKVDKYTGGIFDPNGSTPAEKKAGIAKIKDEWSKVDNQRNVNKLADDSRDLITLILSGSEDFKRGDNNKIVDTSGKTASEYINKKIEELQPVFGSYNLNPDQKKTLADLISLRKEVQTAEDYAKADPEKRSKMNGENLADLLKQTKDMTQAQRDKELLKAGIIEYTNPDGSKKYLDGYKDTGEGPRTVTDPKTGKEMNMPGHDIAKECSGGYTCSGIDRNGVLIRKDDRGNPADLIL